VIVSPVADPVSLQRMGVDPARKINVGSFSTGQRAVTSNDFRQIFSCNSLMRKQKS
jgi:hypothetical protein